MAKEEHKKEVGSEGHSKSKKEKLKLRSIHTTKADDGTYVHEHVYEGKGGERHPPRFGGTSSDMADLHDHYADHFGDQAEGNQEEEGEQPDQAEGAPAAPGGAQPAQ